MKPFEINYELAKNGTSQSQLAKELKVNPQTVNNVINGRTPSEKIAQAICKAIKKNVDQVFPDSGYSRAA